MQKLIELYKKNKDSFCYEIIKSKGDFLTKKDELEFLKNNKEFLDLITIKNYEYFSLLNNDLSYINLIKKTNLNKHSRTLIILDNTLRKYDAKFIVIDSPFSIADGIDTLLELLCKEDLEEGITKYEVDDLDFLESFRIFLENTGYNSKYIKKLISILKKINFTMMII